MDINKNPLVSIIAVAYNHESFIEAALMSLLNQDYTPLEIIISDDNSTDNTFEIASEIVLDYKGPHKIILNRNPINLGIGGNVSKALSLANGELFLAADCDDISELNRVSYLVSYFNSLTTKPFLITTDCFDTTITGEDLEIKRCDDLQEIHSVFNWMSNRPHFYGCSNFYSKRLFHEFGAINSNAGAIDQIMVLRAILLGGAHSLHRPLVHHREGGVTGNKSQNITDKINRLISSSSRTIADIEQHIKDAEKFKYGFLFKTYFKNQLAEALLTPKILKASSLKDALKIFFNDHETPKLKKIRLLSYIGLPLFHRVIFKIKRLIE